MARITVTCLHCGEPVSRYLSQVRGRVFCSTTCRSLHARPEQVCPSCGHTFAHDPHNPTRYCSWECFKRSRWITETCYVCHRRFQSRLCESQKRLDRHHVPCCSRSCRNSYTSLLLGGDGVWVPGGKYNPKRQRGYRWRKLRLLYLISVGFKCEGCGGRAVDIHHLHPTANGGDLYLFDNLMAVCKPCHENMQEQLCEGFFWDSLEAACACL